MAEVEIFYSQMCGLCHKAMDFFREKDVAFDAHEVEWQGGGWKDTPAARRMRQLCGDVDFVPQILIRGRHIKGWRTLEPMIESGEILTLLGDRPPTTSG
jgi:glutaredoxin